jgi:hypothetical protein
MVAAGLLTGCGSGSSTSASSVPTPSTSAHPAHGRSHPSRDPTPEGAAPLPSAAVSPPARPAAGWWAPPQGATWQWQLTTPVNTSVDATVYDIDLFENDASVVDTLHRSGRHVICYTDAGSVEDWRPDAAAFPARVIGLPVPGWPGERWLDIRDMAVLRPLMDARLDLCQRKGFDAVEFDWADVYAQGDVGFPISAADQLRYNTMLAADAHARGLGIALKNDGGQAAQLVSVYDLALSEQCFEMRECDRFTPFIAAGKAVFDAEYNLDPSAFCTDARSRHFSAMAKHVELDGFRSAC